MGLLDHIQTNSIATIFYPILGPLAFSQVFIDAGIELTILRYSLFTFFRSISTFSCLHACGHVCSTSYEYISFISLKYNRGLVYLITVSNSGSVGKGFLLRKYFSSIQQVVSSTAITFRSPGLRMLRLLYRDFNFRLLPTVWLVGVYGSLAVSKRRGDDSKWRVDDT